jgi:acetate kinase
MRVLVINSGSSTVKARMISTNSGQVLGKGLVDRIASPECRLKWEGGTDVVEEKLPGASVDLATRRLVELAEKQSHIEAVGHRIVHGGELFTAPTLIDDKVLEGIDYCSLFAPLHNPAHAEGIRAARAVLPNVSHVAVFDTAFHATIPPYAHRYAIPEKYYKELGVRRYGAHGTSHQYLSAKGNEFLAERGVKAPYRVITLHLGNGCSAAAVLDGVCRETSMGFTPLEGLIMGTRTGDMDCAVVPFLIQRQGWTPAEADRFLNKECGLLGVSGLSPDMRDIEQGRAEGHPGATLAFDMFCYRIEKYVGAFTAVLGGLDLLVFSGGIGENSPEVRRQVVGKLGWLGLKLDENANGALSKSAKLITVESEGPAAAVIPTDEEALIARQTERVVTGS